MTHQTACVHLYTHPKVKQSVNIFIEGEIRDLEALLITAARIDDNFYNALFEAARWIMRDESGEEL